MKLINGRFYDDNNNVIKLEFGNKQQINLIKQKEKMLTELENSFPGRIRHEVYFKSVIDFECPSCKTNRSYEDDEYLEFESNADDFKGSVIHCDKCNTEFEIVGGKRDNVDLKHYE